MEFAPGIVEKLRSQAERFHELTDLLGDPEVASNAKRMTAVLKERGQLEAPAQLSERIARIDAGREECRQMLADKEAEADLRELAQEELAELDAEAEALDEEIKSVLVAEEGDDADKIIVEIRAGAGGDEATLFAADLWRIYQHFIDSQKGWKMEVLEASPTDVGGFKELILGVSGPGVWRRLRFESGGHRVQRVPSTETQGRIHTSAATVAVLPEAEEVELVIDPTELRIDTMRASGAGGQHVNKTESCVRVTHLPTGTMVVCMDGKSQHKNRAQAMRILRSRLFEAKRAAIAAERSEMRKNQVGSGDRSTRIRTYNYPQNRLTDHRLGENFSLEQITAGRLGGLLEALEAMDREERIRNL